MEKVLLTGATGFLGSHLVEYLISKGYSIRCLVRNINKKRWLEGNNNVEFIECDLDSDKVKTHLKDVDYIIHLAGLVKTKNKREFYIVNYDLTKKFVENIINSNIKIKKFIFISTQAAAGPTINTGLKDEICEDLPLTDYGLSKLKAEEYLYSLKGKFPYVILRPSVIYGPRDTEVLVLTKLIKYGFNPLLGTKDKTISLLFVQEAVRGIELAMMNAKLYEKYFLSEIKPVQWSFVKDVIKKILDKKFVINIYLTPGMVRKMGFFNEMFFSIFGQIPVFNTQKVKELLCGNWGVSTIKAGNEFDFISDFDIIKGMQITLDWYKKNKWL